jgi:signal transduction histidine kinase
VRGLIESVLKTFESQLTAAGFSVHRQIADALPLIRGDRTALELMVDNIVDNAIRYSGARKVLEISARRRDAAVDITIRDEGTGIPADEIPQVTRKFVRGRRAGSGGSGLGLAIATRIVTDHGGTLSIRSEVGAGTSVVITLPSAGDAT